MAAARKALLAVARLQDLRSLHVRDFPWRKAATDKIPPPPLDFSTSSSPDMGRSRLPAHPARLSAHLIKPGMEKVIKSMSCFALLL
jgi:hypothetical protein